jgi:hypothetical protein
MTRDKDVFATELRIVGDPRSKHTADDRKTQFDLAMRLYNLLGDMAFAVERMNAMRDEHEALPNNVEGLNSDQKRADSLNPE